MVDSRQSNDLKARALSKLEELEGDAIALFQELIRIPSPNPAANERPVADYAAAYLRSVGMEVQQIEPFPNRVSNVARLRGTERQPALLFNSHLDTVGLTDEQEWLHPRLGAEIHDGMVWGVGAKNMKGGMAAAMFVPRILKECGIRLRGDLVISQTADEMRGGIKGLKEVVERDMLQADFGIYTETGIPPRIEVGHRGMVWIDVVVRGRSAHTTEPTVKKPINAVVKMASVIQHLQRIRFSEWQPHPLLQGEPIMSINMISGGFAENMVPDECRIRCDCRTLPDQTAETVLADFDTLLGELRAQDPELDVRAKIAFDAPYSFIEPDAPIVQELQRAIVEVTGSEMPVLASPATSDSRWLVLVAKIPTCKFLFTTVDNGVPVGSGPNERLKIEDFLNTIRVYLTLTLNLLAAEPEAT